jgi:hypothetical protein
LNVGPAWAALESWVLRPENRIIITKALKNKTTNFQKGAINIMSIDIFRSMNL